MTPRELLATAHTRLSGTPLLIMLDVDGTLAPIVSRPELARIPDETMTALRSLAASPGVHVSLVSGRSAADAHRLGAVPGIWVIGNHGIEMRHPDGHVEVDAVVSAFAPAIAEAVRRLRDRVGAIDGVIVEDKKWTISVHYRLVAEDRVPEILANAAAVAKELGLRELEGKKIAELRPPAEVHKGSASVRLAERLGALDANASLLFAGDDRTDEDAFRALRSRQPRAVTIRILPGGERERSFETSGEFVLRDPDEMRELLEELARKRAA